MSVRALLSSGAVVAMLAASSAIESPEEEAARRRREERRRAEVLEASLAEAQADGTLERIAIATGSTVAGVAKAIRDVALVRPYEDAAELVTAALVAAAFETSQRERSLRELAREPPLPRNGSERRARRYDRPGPEHGWDARPNLSEAHGGRARGDGGDEKRRAAAEAKRARKAAKLAKKDGPR